jgi:ferric-dicitrate binding protein FerR (iron transport regulator)
MKKVILLVLLIVFVYFAFTTHYGPKNPVAEVVSVKGQVTARSVAATVFSVPAVGQQLYGGTHIRTYEKSCTELAMAEDVGQIELGENTYLELRPLSERELKQLNGIVVYRINKQGRDLRIHTPSGMASVLGTVLRVNVTASATEICVREGRVAFVSSDGDRIIKHGGHN